MELSVMVIILGLILAFGSAIAWAVNFYLQGKSTFEGKQSLRSGAKKVLLGYGFIFLGVLLGVLLVLLGLVVHFLL